MSVSICKIGTGIHCRKIIFSFLRIYWGAGELAVGELDPVARRRRKASDTASVSKEQAARLPRAGETARVPAPLPLENVGQMIGTLPPSGQAGETGSGARFQQRIVEVERGGEGVI